MDSTQLQLTSQDLIYVALIGTGIGLALGLIPLVISIKRGKLKLGLLAVLLSTIGGALSAIISVIVVAIFLWLILRKSPTAKPSDGDSTSNSNKS